MTDLHKKKLILVELNEINFELVKLYLNDSKLKNFSFILNDKTRTTNSESDYSKLEPWIQWVSVHTGMNAKEHDISRLGETKNFLHEQIFEKIENKNLNVGILFAMNAINKTKNSKYFIPDPWTETKPSNSFWCKNIYKAVKQIVNDNSSKKIEMKSFLIILLACIRFIRLSKYQFFLKLIFNSFKKKWYKVLVLDFLISEIHINFIKNRKTNFSTVFYNAGAHIQHHYLQNIKKINSKLKNPSWYISSKEDPFKDMLNMYDEILKSYITLINNGYNIIFATGLSQEPYDKIKFYYRLKDHNSFLKKLNIKFNYIQTLMTRDFFIFFDNNVDRDYAEKNLKGIITMDKEEIFDEIEVKDKCLFVTLTYPNEIEKDCEIIYNEQRINFYNEVNFVAIKNGMHSSKGYISYHGDIEKFQPKNNSHVKEIFNSINNFFN